MDRIIPKLREGLREEESMSKAAPGFVLFCSVFNYFNWRIITLQYCDGFFTIHQYESAIGIHTHVLPLVFDGWFVKQNDKGLLLPGFRVSVMLGCIL